MFTMWHSTCVLVHIFNVLIKRNLATEYKAYCSGVQRRAHEKLTTARAENIDIAPSIVNVRHQSQYRLFQLICLAVYCIVFTLETCYFIALLQSVNNKLLRTSIIYPLIKIASPMILPYISLCNTEITSFLS